ncbi:unnamed protein product [Ilex paraguariensis]|uniref:Uncharacterized protein n=1 Tax=Ilex paraguariensis TaxID=185542 RepID=A0ABC8SZL1_9AQUA
MMTRVVVRDKEALGITKDSQLQGGIVEQRLCEVRVRSIAVQTPPSTRGIIVLADIIVELKPSQIDLKPRTTNEPTTYNKMPIDQKNPKPNLELLDPSRKQTHETDPIDSKPKAANNPIAQNLSQNQKEDKHPTQFSQINQILDLCMAKVFHKMSLKRTTQGGSNEGKAFET